MWMNTQPTSNICWSCDRPLQSHENFRICTLCSEKCSVPSCSNSSRFKTVSDKLGRNNGVVRCCQTKKPLSYNAPHSLLRYPDDRRVPLCHEHKGKEFHNPKLGPEKLKCCRRCKKLSPFDGFVGSHCSTNCEEKDQHYRGTKPKIKKPKRPHSETQQTIARTDPEDLDFGALVLEPSSAFPSGPFIPGGLALTYDSNGKSLLVIDQCNYKIAVYSHNLSSLLQTAHGRPDPDLNIDIPFAQRSSYPYNLSVRVNPGRGERELLVTTRQLLLFRWTTGFAPQFVKSISKFRFPLDQKILGEFEDLWGVAWTSEGGAVVVDRKGSNRVVKLKNVLVDLQHMKASWICEGFERPGGVAIDDRYAYVADRESLHLLAAETGTRLASFPTWRQEEPPIPFDSSCNIAITSGRDIWISFDYMGRLKRFTPRLDLNGVITGIAEVFCEAGIASPVGITIDESIGVVYLGNTSGLKVLSYDLNSHGDTTMTTTTTQESILQFGEGFVPQPVSEADTWSGGVDSSPISLPSPTFSDDSFQHIPSPSPYDFPQQMEMSDLIVDDELLNWVKLDSTDELKLHNETG